MSVCLTVSSRNARMHFVNIQREWTTPRETSRRKLKTPCFLAICNVHCKWIAFHGVICRSCKVFDNINSSAVFTLCFYLFQTKSKTISKSNQHWARTIVFACSSLHILRTHISIYGKMNFIQRHQPKVERAVFMLMVCVTCSRYAVRNKYASHPPSSPLRPAQRTQLPSQSAICEKLWW